MNALNEKKIRSVGRRAGFFMALPVIAGAILFVPAVAAEDEIQVPFEDALVADSGSTTEVASVAIDPELVGEVCKVSVNVDNQVSVHPGNNLIVRSGSAEVLMTGVEDEADGKAVESQEITLGEQLVVELVMGPDGSSSLGFGVSILCNEDEPPVVEETPAAPAKVEGLQKAPVAKPVVKQPTYTG